LDSNQDHGLTETVIGFSMKLSKADEVQLVNYLTATNRDFGLLLNFGGPSLQFKRKYRRASPESVNVDLQNPKNTVNPV